MTEIDADVRDPISSSDLLPKENSVRSRASFGYRRLGFLCLGFICLGLAYLGWLLPGLPCTPFVILASLCFGKSSPRLQGWLVGNRLFGPILRDFHEHRGIQRKYKIRSTFFVIVIVSASMAYFVVTGRPWYLWALLPLLMLVGLSVIWFGLRTLPDGGNLAVGARENGESELSTASR